MHLVSMINLGHKERNARCVTALNISCELNDTATNWLMLDARCLFGDIRALFVYTKSASLSFIRRDSSG